MARPKKESLQELFTKAVNLLEAGVPFPTIYPILRDATPEVAKLYGKHPGPQIRLRRVEYRGFSDDWHLWTTIPSVDFTHEAQWNSDEPLSTEDEAMLRAHVILILKLWLAEDALFSAPISKSDVAARLDVDVRTLWTMVENEDIRVIELNKHMVRILKSQLPPKQ